ncbi:MAG: hypothetical protein NWE76_02625, partial [Candidatus Bathyarchaeota archaeon]|nr:hypothetical protein [Candidatus Bathyarchaeota archaeon]
MSGDRSKRYAGIQHLIRKYRKGEKPLSTAKGVVLKELISGTPSDSRETKSAKLKDPLAPEVPEGVTLRDLGDHKGLRNSIYEGVKQQVTESFPHSYGGVRIELDDVDYADKDYFSIADQKKAIMQNKFLGRRLRGTFRLYDEATNEELDSKTVTLMKVPHLTNRGTFVHGGNEYVSMMQSRLIPGAYTRKQANGELETQFNVRPGTGRAFRVSMNPKDAQFRMRIQQSNLHLYSLLHDLGVPDEQLAETWGPEILEINKKKYDKRVLDKAYQRLVNPRKGQEAPDEETKKQTIQEALERSQMDARVARLNLPNLFEKRAADEWNAQWEGVKAASCIFLKKAGMSRE